MVDEKGRIAALRAWNDCADAPTSVRLEAALEDYEAARGEWRPIETAPRDGTRFLVCAFTDNSKRKACIFTPDGEEFVGVANHYQILQLRWDDEHDSFYDEYGDERIVDLQTYFTHWMPLPQHPALLLYYRRFQRKRSKIMTNLKDVTERLCALDALDITVGDWNEAISCIREYQKQNEALLERVKKLDRQLTCCRDNVKRLKGKIPKRKMSPFSEYHRREAVIREAIEKASKSLSLAIEEAEVSVGKTDRFVLFDNTLMRVRDAQQALEQMEEK